jgi:kinetochore protein Mis13/DSN1
LSDWFSREETVPTAVVKKPNPINERNQATLQELEEEVKRYVFAARTWCHSGTDEQIGSKKKRPPGKP